MYNKDPHNPQLYQYIYNPQYFNPYNYPCSQPYIQNSINQANEK
jgi:hypothetical protein